MLVDTRWLQLIAATGLNLMRMVIALMVHQGIKGAEREYDIYDVLDERYMKLCDEYCS